MPILSPQCPRHLPFHQHGDTGRPRWPPRVANNVAESDPLARRDPSGGPAEVRPIWTVCIKNVFDVQKVDVEGMLLEAGRFAVFFLVFVRPRLELEGRTSQGANVGIRSIGAPDASTASTIWEFRGSDQVTLAVAGADAPAGTSLNDCESPRSRTSKSTMAALS